MKMQTGLIVGAIVVILAALITFQAIRGTTEDPAKTALAQCLSQKGVIMYGADWCPHCQQAESNFGPSFKYVNYVACQHTTTDPLAQACKDAGISAYPTWVWGDQRKTGLVDLGQIAQFGNCTQALQQG